MLRNGRARTFDIKFTNLSNDILPMIFNFVLPIAHVFRYLTDAILFAGILFRIYLGISEISHSLLPLWTFIPRDKSTYGIFPRGDLF